MNSKQNKCQVFFTFTSETPGLPVAFLHEMLALEASIRNFPSIYLLPSCFIVRKSPLTVRAGDNINFVYTADIMLSVVDYYSPRLLSEMIIRRRTERLQRAYISERCRIDENFDLIREDLDLRTYRDCDDLYYQMVDVLRDHDPEPTIPIQACAKTM